MAAQNRFLTATGISVLLSSIWLSPALAAEKLTLPSIWGSHMVLQRDMPLTIWGWGKPAETVNIDIDGKTFSATATADGEWKVTLPAMKAGGPLKITVKDSQTTIVLDDILVGEVWFCCGQSNMEMGIGVIDNADTEIATAKFPKIRLFEVPRRSEGSPVSRNGGHWFVCSPETVGRGNWGGFSAVGFLFGREIHEKIGVPVGLIDSTWGGTLIEPWTPPEGFASIPSLKHINDDLARERKQYRESVKHAIQPLQDWIDATQEAIDDGAPITPTPYLPHNPLSNHEKPCSLYNGMVHPYLPFAIRGFLWYQGESNIRTDDSDTYLEKMEALVSGLREVWGQGDFPFYYVQIAPFNYKYHVRDYSPYLEPRIWEAQRKALKIPNTGMVVTTDVADLRDVHPRRKQAVGKRLAMLALNEIYGQKSDVYASPFFKSMEIDGKEIRITFENTGGVLKTSDGKPVSWLSIAGKDKKFAPAQSRIEGDTLVVWSNAITNPVAVRYGWHMTAEPNLVNKIDLPASPFRTDSWDTWYGEFTSERPGQN